MDMLRTGRGLVLATAIVLVGVTASPFAQATNPRFGKWKLKSTNPTSTNIMTYEAYNGTGMKITVDTSNATTGAKSSWGYTTMFDGKAQPVVGQDGTSAVVTVITDKITEIIYKKGDKLSQFLVNVLSDDNNSIEVSYYRTDAQGKTNETHATYERIQ